MRLEVLGCSGGIGGSQSRTTSFLVDDDILIDCGTGVGDLPLEVLRRIDHVFLTHVHLDHIAALPLLVDTVGELRASPLVVHALGESIAALQAHIFNWQIWPDFTAIPDRERPFMRFSPLQVGDSVELDGRCITALPARHTIPSVAYGLDSGHGQLVFSGDTAYCEELIDAINACPQLRHLILETAFAEDQQALASASRHLCPSSAHAMLDRIGGAPRVHVSHLKPGASLRIMEELHEGGRILRRLGQGDVLEF
ncbi:3',5'-cyclic-nucleotide phosphodiesterase [Thauera sp. WH-2]|jgi:3',5'-cyclic-nucleotide phosphodiesterase|uniref:3',5'-cyclic-nucleotide phosphodiesterase n=1 Tax=unclassified Thauera TaxID=2609274 RepID=UPI002A46BB7B|nr:3',5'-cyclic-nucleotide phosphodiesterase [Thauera sp.]